MAILRNLVIYIIVTGLPLNYRNHYYIMEQLLLFASFISLECCNLSSSNVPFPIVLLLLELDSMTIVVGIQLIIGLL